METIQIATEDKFIVVKFSDQFADSGSPRILQHLVKFGFTNGYTLIVDCRGIRNPGDSVARGILEICKAGTSVICVESNRRLLEETWRAMDASFRASQWPLFAHDGQLHHAPMLTVRRNTPRLNYVNLELESFDERLLNRHNEVDRVSKRERQCAEQFVNARHREIDDVAEQWHKDRTEEWLKSVPPFHALLSRLPRSEVSDLDDFRDEVRGNYFENSITALRSLHTIVRSHASNSLLIEYVMQLSGESISFTPYHSCAVHSIEAKQEVLLGRPAVIARKTASLFAPEIHEFKMLLANRQVRERDIQVFLERNPSIFKALGYAQIYPQVVLERDDGSSLRPDFIVQPTSDEWCDIIDLKLPTMQTVVGSRDRRTLSSAIHELSAQLREYSAYFENEKLSRRVERQYGIKCYRPRLIGVIGTDPRLADERQMRRLMTAYSDVKVLTFDQLLRHAKTRLLI